MQLAFRCCNGPTSRALRPGARTLPDMRKSPLLTPSLAASRGSRQARTLSGCMNGAWSQAVHTITRSLTTTAAGQRRLFGQSALHSRPHQQRSAKEKDKIGLSDSESLKSNRSGKIRNEGVGGPRHETRTKNSPAGSSQTGAWPNRTGNLNKETIQD